MLLNGLKKMEDSLVDKRISEHGENVIKIKLVVKNLGTTTTISNTNLVVLNNYHLSLDSKSELIYFGRVF